MYHTCIHPYFNPASPYLDPGIATRSSHVLGSSGEPCLYQINLVPPCDSRMSSSRLSSLHQRFFTLSCTSPSHIKSYILFYLLCGAVPGSQASHGVKPYSQTGALRARPEVFIKPKRARLLVQRSHPQTTHARGPHSTHRLAQRAER